MSSVSNIIEEPPSSVYEHVFAGGEIQEDGWPGVNGIIGSSAAIKQILEHVKTVAPLDSTVLIQGETGTGKELIASAIHNLSSRRKTTSSDSIVQLCRQACWRATCSGTKEGHLLEH
jgi:Transcriptional regulator containing GAF, AAA-type ATPase, and DNA binding domains